jgi:hypothetical protein
MWCSIHVPGRRNSRLEYRSGIGSLDSMNVVVWIIDIIILAGGEILELMCCREQDDTARWMILQAL